MCMPILTLVVKISFSHYCFFFNKPMYLRVTTEFGEISENCDFWSNIQYNGLLLEMPLTDVYVRQNAM